MSRLTYTKRQRLPSSSFVFRKSRRYPIDTANRARNALARVAQSGSDYERRKVCAAVKKRYPDIHAQSCMVHKLDRY